MASSLRSRLALLLVLANLPAALLAIGATVKGRDAETAQRESALVQRAELIAARAGLALGIAEGVADTLAATPEVLAVGRTCDRQLRAALSFRPEYTGIVVSDGSGRILCSYGETDISEESHTALIRASRTATNAGENNNVVVLPEQIRADDKVVMLSRAFTTPGGEPRAIGLLLRRDAFEAIFLSDESRDEELSALALIRTGGEVVSDFSRGREGSDWRPAEPLPVSATPSGMYSPTRDGVSYHFATAPVQGTMASIVLATPMSVIAATDWMRFLTAIAAPLLMLLLGILAVFAGVDRLVLRWISRFRQVTAAYALGNYTPRIPGLETAPSELAELGSGIHDMAERVRDRSTALEEALDGKNALLRELHHRVKNNFQMIASLLALQRRELPSRLRVLLRVPEDRVLAMASAYKASYATGEIGLVSASELLRDIAAQLRQSFGVGAPPILVDSGDAAIWLDLDQAVPLGLLVSELVTAALERHDAAERPIDIRVIKRADEDGGIEIEIKSRGIVDSVPATGLAARLVTAYRTQTGATLTTPGDDVVLIAMSAHGDSQAHPGRVEFGS